jgi:hypothetical protein
MMVIVRYVIDGTDGRLCLSVFQQPPQPTTPTPTHLHMLNESFINCNRYCHVPIMMVVADEQ